MKKIIATSAVLGLLLLGLSTIVAANMLEEDIEVEILEEPVYEPEQVSQEDSSVYQTGMLCDPLKPASRFPGPLSHTSLSLQDSRRR